MQHSTPDVAAAFFERQRSGDAALTKKVGAYSESMPFRLSEWCPYDVFEPCAGSEFCSSRATSEAGSASSDGALVCRAKRVEGGDEYGATLFTEDSSSSFPAASLTSRVAASPECPPATKAAAGVLLKTKVACPHCDRIFKTRAGLASHIRHAHPEEDKKEAPKESQRSSAGKLPCPHCGTRFTSDIQGHHVLVAPEEAVEESVLAASEEPATSEESCSACTSEEGDRPPPPPPRARALPKTKLACPHCDRIFKMRAGLASHIRHAHPDVGSNE